MIPRSAISGIEWPAVPSPSGSMILALLHQLQESEWLSAAELERRQLEALHRLLRHACVTVPYYRDSPAYTTLASRPEITMKDWARLPVLTRDDVQLAGDALLSEKIPPDHEPVAHTFTAGSTGTPLRVVGTVVTGLFWMANTLREQLWHGRDLGGKLAAIRAEQSDGMPPGGLTLGGWGPAIDAVYETGPCELFSMERDVKEQAVWLRKQDPEFLLSYPSNLLVLARYFAATRAQVPRLRQVCSYGEVLTPEVRAECEAAWNVRVVDMYSTEELGYVALQCPRSDQYHTQAESVMVEVLDGRGRRCPSGTIGAVVASGLHNYAMPLLRYDLGDYAVVGEECLCGRGLPTLSRLMGRARNMLVLPSGQRVWPTFSRNDWSKIEVIEQVQLVQHDADLIEARIIGPKPLTSDEETEFASMLEQSLGYGFRIWFTYHESIDRSQTPKFEEFLSVVGA